MDTTPNVALPNASAAPALVRPRYWYTVGRVGLLVTLFWLLEFVYQYYVLVPELLGIALVRSLGLTGATLISAALLCSIVFKFYPRLAGHWHLRRRLGVAGFVFICCHVALAIAYYYSWNLGFVYFSWNPLENPVVFGTIALPILFVMAATSTDWAVRQLGRWWKFIHRFVYVAFVAAIFHFILINPTALYNPAGYFLGVLVVATLLGQFYWYIRISALKHFRSLGAAVGALIILLSVVMGYFVYLQLFS